MSNGQDRYRFEKVENDITCTRCHPNDLKYFENYHVYSFYPNDLKNHMYTPYQRFGKI